MKASSSGERSRLVIELVLSVAGPALLIALWELLSRTSVIDSRFWPPPSTLWDTGAEMVRDDGLLDDVRITVFRILAGFALGSIPGIVIGLGMGLFWPIRTFFMPLATAIYAIPKIAILPLTIIAFGIGETSKLFTVAISIVFLVALSTMSGVLELDRSYRDVGKNFGASAAQMFTTVALPGALPAIFTGLRLALGFALVVVVGTEFVNARDGLGYLIWNAYQTLRIREMFVGLILTGVLGLGLTALLSVAENLAMPWRRADRRRTSWRAWLQAMRVRSFTTSTIPVVASTLLARVEGAIRWDYFALMLVASVLTHAACNLTNDYFDERRGVDSDATLGQSGVLQDGSIGYAQMQVAITICFAGALIFALPIIADVGQPILWLAIASAAAAFFYTAGPFPLAYYALGEVTVFLAMGLGMVMGVYYVHTSTISASAVLLAIAMGLLSAGFLHANNIRDIDTDRTHDKRTMANLLPRRVATLEFAGLELMPFLLLPAMIAIEPATWPIAIALALLPRTVNVIRRVAAERDSSRLNPLVRRSAGLHFGYGVLVSIGLLLTMAIDR